MEVLADLQFELLTTWLNDGRRMPQRSGQNPAHAYLAAPYGVYRTADGHIAIAMGKLDVLARLTGLDAATATLDPFAARDTIKAGKAHAEALHRAPEPAVQEGLETPLLEAQHVERRLDAAREAVFHAALALSLIHH